MEKKHHYRAVFKSDHLSSADLEDLIEEKKPLVFTIKNVKQEIETMVAGKRGNFNIAYFVENIKPMVLNATNSKIIKGFANSPFVEDWNNIKVELYVDNKVKFGKEIMSGVRISALQPLKKEKKQFTSANFEAAKNAGATIEKIKELYNVDLETEKNYLDYAKK